MLFREDTAARAQHQAVREAAGWYRWTHDLVEVRGADAERFLEHLYVNKLSGMETGKTKYTTMLNEDGKIIDDVIVMHMDENHYWISTLYGPQFIQWADGHSQGFDVSYEDITQRIDMYSVQGPTSPEIMKAIVATSLDGLERFQIEDNSIGGKAVKIHRSGFTGELGYEVYCDMADSKKIEAAIKQTGATELDILEVYVRSLPVEKGFALRQDMFGLTPYECGLGWSVHLDKDFIGKEALLRAKEDGPQYKLVGLEFEAESYEDIAQKEIIYSYGIPCGYVTAAIYGYTVDKNIGFGVIKAGKAKVGDRVTVGCNDSPAIITKKSWI